jgi:Mrp family chromosome partitioning ATPase
MSWHDEQAGEGRQARQPAPPGGTASDSSPLAAEEHTQGLNVPSAPLAAAFASASGAAVAAGDGWESSAAQDHERVGLHFFGGARIVAMISPKGGVAKTTSPWLVSQAFGRFGQHSAGGSR